MKLPLNRYLRTRFILFFRRSTTFLRSKISREFGIFLFFLLLSFSFWIMHSLNDIVEDNLKLPLSYTIPDKLVITSVLPQEIDVRLRDKGTVLLSYYLQKIQPVEIDLSGLEKEEGIFIIPPQQIKQHIQKQLISTTSVASFIPDSISIYYTLSAGKQVPIRLRTHITTVPRCIVDSTITHNTDSVTVYAPRSILDKIDYVYADSLVAYNLSDTLYTDLKIENIQGARIIPDQVKATVFVEEITLKQFDVPITVENLPEQYTLITFPASTQVSCLIPISQFAKITQSSFKAIINYNNIATHSGKKQPIILHTPSNFGYHIEIAPDSVEYIIEER